MQSNGLAEEDIYNCLKVDSIDWVRYFDDSRVMLGDLYRGAVNCGLGLIFWSAVLNACDETYDKFQLVWEFFLLLGSELRY